MLKIWAFAVDYIHIPQNFMVTNAQRNRSPIITVFVIACWADALSRLFFLFFPYRYTLYSSWYQQVVLPISQTLGLFPVPGAIPYTLLSLKYPATMTTMIVGSNLHVMIPSAVGVIVSAILGYGLWRMRPWARWAAIGLVPSSLVALCLLPRTSAFKESIGWLEVWRNTGLITNFIFAAAIVYVLVRLPAYPAVEQEARVAGAPSKPVGVVVLITSLLTLLNGWLAFIFWQSTIHVRPYQGLIWPAFLWWIFPLFSILSVVLLLRTGPGAFALGLAAGLSLLVLVEGLPAVKVFPILVLIGIGNFGMVAAAALPLNLINGGFALAALRKLPLPSFSRAGNALLALFLPFAAFALAMGLTEEVQHTANVPQITPEQARHWEEIRNQQQRATEHLRIVARCAFEYFGQHPTEGFPAELSQIGAEGAHCVPPDLTAPSDSGYEFSYQSGRSGGEGKIDHFVYTASRSPAAAKAPSSPSVMTIDENGIFSSSGFLYNRVLVLLIDVQNCLERYRWQDPANHYPASMTEVLAMKGELATECVRFFGEHDERLTNWPAGRPIQYQGYELIYSSSGNQYGIQARPKPWGEKFFRSFLLEEGGIIHGTPFDRAAAPDDPEIKACEFNAAPCSPGPWNFEFIAGGIPKQQ